MKVSYFMVPKDKVLTCYAEDSVKSAGQAMIDNGHSCVIVWDGTNPVGIVTKTDIVRALCVENVSKDTEVKYVMSTKLSTIADSSPVDEVAKALAARHVHHLVVVGKNGEFVGLTSALDVANEYALDAKAFPYSRDALQHWPRS
eukprot:comp18313_c0_seq3/m.32509 comp18313_c0_seq3/g.32509  ORF comp18313_c0_seq3/g.32509 comp18313_c0_seq3/m.32509 type:complete len:144 (+) comp18313_c0_seq3:126-557(+)